MMRDPVSSSNIMSAGYDAASETLEVEFKDGAVYQYFNVSGAMYDSFMQASSKGQYFNTYIRNSLPFSRVG